MFLIELQIAFVGVIVSSLFAALGLILNYRALRRSNRIAVSSRLAELCNLLSDEMKALSELRLLFMRQLEQSEKHNVSSETAQKNLAEVENRQSVISGQIETVTQCFDDLDGVDPAEVDAMICKAILEKGVHEHAIDYARRGKLAR